MYEQALKNSEVVELVDEQIRRKVEPEHWPIPTPALDFSQLIHCPEFIPGQTFTSLSTGSDVFHCLAIFIVLGIVLQCCFAVILLFCLVLKMATLTLFMTLTHLLTISPSTCATVSSSPVSQHIVEPALVNGLTSDDTDAAKPQSKESSPSDSKSSSSEDGNTPKERSSALSDPEAQPWVQVEKRHRNSSGKNKVLPDPSLVMSLRFVVMHYILMIMPTFVFR